MVNIHGGSRALRFASDDLRMDRNVVLVAVSQDSSALRFVRDEGVLGDKDIKLAAISVASSETDISLTAYYHFTGNNVEFVLFALKKD